MSKFTKYIKRYWRSTESLAGGLNTSIKVFFRKKVTEQYPENRHTTLYIPERHRAQLEMIHNNQNQHHCVACGLCQMACPNDTIRVVSEVREDAEGKKKKYLNKKRLPSNRKRATEKKTAVLMTAPHHSPRAVTDEDAGQQKQQIKRL